MPPTLSITITLLCLTAILWLAGIGARSGFLGPESARKAVHIGMGLLCLSFPWLFDSVLAVQILSAMAVLALLVVRLSKLRRSVGSALFSVKRLSIGELLFPAAVGWLYTLSWDQPLLYCISLLLLTLADSASALAGSKLGKKIYQTSGASKSMEGSLAFFLTGFFCAAIPLYIFSSEPLCHTLFLSINIALFTMAVEGASGHGLDNLLIPIGAFLLMDYYMELSGNAMILRSVAMLILLSILLLTHKRHTLNGGAILTALLFSFASFTLGGLPCLLASVILFIRHMLVQRRLRQDQIVIHSMDVILAITLPALLWLTLARGHIIPYNYGQFGFISTLAIIIYMLNTGTQKHTSQPTQLTQPTRLSMLPGLGLSLLLLTPTLLLDIPLLHLLPTLLLAPLSAWIYYHWRGDASTPAIFHWIKLSLLAFIASSLSQFIILP